eukprot:COSAG01_NODE_3922_length_5532_cov_16.368053_5_plen_268_part_00
MDLRATLGQAKAEIAAILGVAADSVHLRRGQRAPMLKSEHVTLRSLGLCEGSPLLVAAGPVLAEGEHMLRLQLYHAGKLSLLCEMKAAATSDVASLKERVASAVADSTASQVVAARAAVGWGAGGGEGGGGEGGGEGAQAALAQRVRLRDCQGGAEVGKVLHDRRTLKGSLARLADGREVAVQLLAAPESVGPQDVILGAAAGAAASFLAAVLTEIYLCDVCSCQEMLRRHGRAQASGAGACATRWSSRRWTWSSASTARWCSCATP